MDVDPEGEVLEIRRRRPRGRPLRATRVGTALYAGPDAAGAPSADFPGIYIPEREDNRRGWLSGGVSLLLHGAIFGIVFIAGWVTHEEILDEPIEVRLIKEPPAPKTDPAPARRVIAERRSAVFQPQAQAVAPQVNNPRVVARAAPQVAAQKLEVASVARVAAPRNVRRTTAPTVERVATVRGTAAAVTSRVEIQAYEGPAVRGPIEIEAPAGPSAGPRQVARSGNTVGTGSVRLGDGSSVREGIDSTRDVLGSATGPRLGDVDTSVGEGFMDGSGGTGAGGVARAPCLERPAVQRYIDDVRRRMTQRWKQDRTTPDGTAELRFRLDPAGSVLDAGFVGDTEPAIGEGAVMALRSAAPFPPMRDEVRCLSGTYLIGRFTAGDG